MCLTQEQQTLVATHMRLVPWLFNRYFRPRFARMEDDILGAGYLALSRAAERFDADRGVLFITYARQVVYHGMARHVDCLAPIPIPMGAYRPGRKAYAYRAWACMVDVADVDPSTDDPTAAVDAADEADRLLAHLPPSQAHVVRQHLLGRTFAEIAAERGTTPQAAQHAWASALVKMRRIRQRRDAAMEGQ